MHKAKSMFAAALLAMVPLASAQAQTGNLSISTQMEAVFNLAAELYPDWFTNGDPLGLYEGYTYRFFPKSGIYVGIKNDEVYVMGGPFGSAITKQGTVAGVKAFLDDEKLKIDIEHGNTDAAGEYDLTITGTVTATVLNFPVSTPLNVTIRDIKAPDANDLDEVEDAIRESLADVGTVSEVKIVVVNNTANRITFDLEFRGSVTSQGVTVNSSYNLRYDYVK